MVQWDEMKKRTRKSIRTKHVINWLPIDSRLFLPLFSFGHVKGIARWFLEMEIVLSTLVVLGVLILFLLRITA